MFSLERTLNHGEQAPFTTHACVNVMQAAIKVVGVDQQTNVTSKRPKYVAVHYIGNRVPSLRKGLYVLFAFF